MKPVSGATGQAAEDAALSFLKAQGLRLVKRNFRCRAGEIDLIMRDGAGLVFVEVRYRRQSRFGSALESVTTAKRTKLAAAAKWYLQGADAGSPCRFDVVGISGEKADRIDWIRDAFQTEP